MTLAVAVAGVMVIGGGGGAAAQTTDEFIGPVAPPPNILPGPLTIAHSGKCLDIAGASVADGAQAQQFTCHDGANQQWRGSASGGLVAEHSGKCLQPVSTAEGAVVQQFTCDSQNPQQAWELRLVNNTNYLHHIVSLGTGMCLTIQDGSAADGATVHMRPCNLLTTPGQIFVNTKAPPPDAPPPPPPDSV